MRVLAVLGHLTVQMSTTAVGLAPHSTAVTTMTTIIPAISSKCQIIFLIFFSFFDGMVFQQVLISAYFSATTLKIIIF